MDDIGQASSSMFSFHRRNPNFRQTEIRTLVQLIQKYKHLVLNKATNSAANYAKEKGWAKIARDFNRQGAEVERSMDVLRTKWDNLKRSARKISKDVMNDDSELHKNDIYSTVIEICASEINEADESKEELLNNEEDELKPWTDDDNELIASDGETPGRKQKIKFDNSDGPSRSNFLPQECSLLLQCVRQEKSTLFSKSPSNKRHEAWMRITEHFNKQSPKKRSSKELINKFHNMKTMAKKININGYIKNVKRKRKYEQLTKRKKYERLHEKNIDPKVQVKIEPVLECGTDYDPDSDDDRPLRIAPELTTDNHEHINFIHDPLNNAQGSDSGLGSISDNKETARLKSELYSYKMETARLERKRIEAAIKADEKERELRDLETSMRLRTARLELVAAENKLPATHFAQKYTEDERLVQQYLRTNLLDIG